MKDNSRKELAKWQERLDRNMSAYGAELLKMDEREAQYNGDRTLRPTTSNDKLKDGRKRTTAHVWNITAENIDAIVDSTIPMPKVIPLWKKDEALARSWAGLYAQSLASWAKRFNAAQQAALFRVSEAEEAPLLKAEGWFRYQVVVRAPAAKDIVAAVAWIETARPAPKDLRIAFDVDAQNFA